MPETRAWNFPVCTNTASGKEESDFYLSRQGQMASLSMLIDSQIQGQTRKKARPSTADPGSQKTRNIHRDNARTAAARAHCWSVGERASLNTARAGLTPVLQVLSHLSLPVSIPSLLLPEGSTLTSSLIHSFTHLPAFIHHIWSEDSRCAGVRARASIRQLRPAVACKGRK